MNSLTGRPSNSPMRHVLAAVVLSVLMLAAWPVSALDAGDRAPEIGLPDLDGRPVRMTALRGKVVIVDFWASWCGPCREELPALNRLYERYRSRGLVVVGVSVDRREANVRRFLQRSPVAFPIVHDPDHRVAARYGPGTMPSSYIVDRRGVVRHVHEGFRSGDEATIERRVRALLDRDH